MSGSKPQGLLLDVGGVLLGDALAGVFDRLDRESALSRREITDYYLAELRLSLWNGSMLEEVFWERILSFSMLPVDIDQWRSHLSSLMVRLPACDEFMASNFDGRVWILSNHRAEWLRPRLESEGILEFVDGVSISSESGLVKPDEAAFTAALRSLKIAPPSVVFVDDTPANLETASSLGMNSVMEDGSGAWAKLLSRGEMVDSESTKADGERAE